MGINNCWKSVFIASLHFYAKLSALKSNNMGESAKSSTKVRHFCNLCTKNYAHRSGLRRHMRTVHENAVPDGFKCQKCQKTFQSARSLGSHSSTCSPLRATYFKCTKCSDIFGRKSNRDRHEIVCSNTTCGVSTSKQREGELSRGSGFNVQFGGGRGSTKTKWRIEKIRQCLNVAVTYRATPNIEITTIGGVHHAMQSFKTIIIDRFKMFHGVKIHFNVEGTCLYIWGKIFKCITFYLDVVLVGIVPFFILTSLVF